MATLKAVLNEILTGNIPVEEQERMLMDVQASIQKTIEQKRIKEEKINTNVDKVLQALSAIEQRVNNKLEEIRQLPAMVGSPGKDGKDGKDGKAGRDGRDGSPGKAGKDGADGKDGQDGVSVVDARIDFDNSLVLTLSNGEVIDAGNLNFNLSNIEGYAVIKQGSDTPSGGGGGGSSDQTTVTVVFGNSTIANTAQTVLIDSATDCTLTLPAAGSNNGKMIYFKSINNGDVTFVGGGLIDGYANMIMQFKNSSFRLISDGSGWYIF